MKTTLRYLLSMVMVLSVLSVSAATFGKPYETQKRGIQYTQLNNQMPVATMSSTSSDLVSSGSTLPMAAVSGTTMADDNAPARVRRAKRDVGGGSSSTEDDKDPDAPEEPFPVGDAAWPLMLMAMLFAGVVYTRRKKALKG